MAEENIPNKIDKNAEKQSDKKLGNVAGGFSYSRSYSYNSAKNGYVGSSEYINEYNNENYQLSEKERQILRDKGCKFILSDSTGEINGVKDNRGNKLAPEQIASFLKNK